MGALSAVSANETDSGFLLAEGFGLIIRIVLDGVRGEDTRRFGAHPTGLAPLLAQQSVQELVRRRSHSNVTEHRPHPRFNVP